MFGFIFGTVCLIALVKMAKHGRGCGGYGYGYGGGCGGGGHHGGCGRGRWGGRHGWGGHHGGWGGHHGGPDGYDERGAGFGPEGMAMRYLFRQLETTPGQEKVIAEAVRETREKLRDARGEWKRTRDDLARAFAGESLDETALGGAYARQDELVQSTRKAVVDALSKVHGVLDERQRRRLAELISNGPGGFGAFGGAPYRM